MTLLLANTTGVQKSSIRLSERDLMMSSMPIPLISPQENPIMGFLSELYTQMFSVNMGLQVNKL